MSIRYKGYFDCGIYKITNTINNKAYIGSSHVLSKRIKEHKRRLKQNNHANHHLQSSWNKYGEDIFSFEIIFLCPEQDLENTEIFFIDHFKSFHKDGGYNMTTGGDGCGKSGMQHPKYGKDPWNKGKTGLQIPWNKGLIHPNPYGSYNEKKIIQYDKKGLLIKEWNSITEASRKLLVNRGSISNCVSNKSKTSGGFVWKYKQ